MKPRILIDVSSVTNVPDGLSIYIVNLLEHLPDSTLDELDVSLLVNPRIDRADFKTAVDGRAFRIMEQRISPLGPRRDWEMHRFLNRHEREFDLIHIPSMAYPLSLRGGIWTIHDVTFKSWFHNPGNIPGSGRLAVAYLTMLVRSGLKRAQKIIAVSNSTRSEIGALFAPTAAEIAKISVVYEGWEHLNRYEPDRCTDFQPSKNGYLFFLGSYRRHKNLSRLLEAFELALDRIPPGKQLVISGGSVKLSSELRASLARLNAKQERVRFTGLLSSDCVGRYYQEADGFLFPSLAEGFGIPVLESFHYGTPLLCSLTTSIPEVAGDAAIYFDPFDPRSIADGIVRLYGEPEAAAENVRRGHEQLKLFSWHKTAEETLAIYRSALRERA